MSKIVLDTCDLVIARTHKFVGERRVKPSLDACHLAIRRKMCKQKCLNATPEQHDTKTDAESGEWKTLKG